MAKNKNKLVIDIALEHLEKLIDETDKMFEDRKESHAYIIGYLKGGMKGVISFLNENTK